MIEPPIQSVPAAEVAGKTLVEEFMALSYEFRRNVLSDKYEMREVYGDSEASQADGRPTDANPKPWRDVVRILAKSFPELKQNHGTIIKVGILLKSMNFDQKDLAQGSAYFVVPIKKAA